MDTPEEVLEALGRYGHNTQIEALLIEIKRAYSDLPGNNAQAQVAETVLGMIQCYLDDETLASQCNKEGLLLLLRLEGRREQDEDIPTNVERYIRSCALLALTPGLCTSVRLGCVIKELVKGDMSYHVIPSEPVARDNITENLLEALSEVRSMRGDEPAPAPLDLDRNRISGLAV